MFHQDRLPIFGNNLNASYHKGSCLFHFTSSCKNNMRKIYEDTHQLQVEGYRLFISERTKANVIMWMALCYLPPSKSNEIWLEKGLVFLCEVLG